METNVDLITTILIIFGWIIVIIGWVIASKLASERDRLNKRLELKLKYLVETWFKVEGLAATEEKDLSDDIGIIIGNIQLFGSLRQIELVNKMVNDIGEKQTADLKELINQLRQDIRKELEMEFIPENIDFYKFAKKIE